MTTFARLATGAMDLARDVELLPQLRISHEPFLDLRAIGRREFPVEVIEKLVGTHRRGGRVSRARRRCNGKSTRRTR
jgi:hypothetical protein